MWPGPQPMSMRSPFWLWMRCTYELQKLWHKWLWAWFGCPNYLTLLSVSYPTLSGCKEKSIRVAHIYLTNTILIFNTNYGDQGLCALIGTTFLWEHKWLVARVLCRSVILHTWVILIGYPTKTKLWLVMEDHLYEPKLMLSYWFRFSCY